MSGKFDYSHAEAINPDLILFYGWSSIIPQFILDSFTCLIHPSRLPEFRSPLQNQIIRGVSDSAVTIFKMTMTLDAGPIGTLTYHSKVILKRYSIE